MTEQKFPRNSSNFTTEFSSVSRQQKISYTNWIFFFLFLQEDPRINSVDISHVAFDDIWRTKNTYQVFDLSLSYLIRQVTFCLEPRCSAKIRSCSCHKTGTGAWKTVYALFTVVSALCFESPRKNSREELAGLQRTFARGIFLYSTLRFVLHFVTSACTFIEIQAPYRDGEDGESSRRRWKISVGKFISARKSDVYTRAIDWPNSK